MDVTPRELRDIEIREAFRGYNRDDVDELLERAAATIEALTERVRQLADRAQAAPVGAAIPMQGDDLIQRTLLLAQRTADEAVAEAEAKARQLVEDAEARAATLTEEAETVARRRAEEEQARITAELTDLATRREALTNDVDALERYAGTYRDRIREALARDLEALRTGGSVTVGARPELSGVEVEIPAVPEASAADAAAPAPTPVEPGPPTLPLAAVTADEPASPSTTTWAPAPEAAVESSPAPAADALPGRGGTPSVEARVTEEPTMPPPGRRERMAVPTGGELPPAEHLDDDAFFASLREAVSDDAPLGPREEGDELGDGPGDVFDQDTDDDGGGRGLFRRRG